jgi:TRAP-type uncharacterized transport system fused permease subunit
MTAATLDEKKLQELEEKFDPEMRFRPSCRLPLQIIKWLLIALSCFHFYTAGFGLLRETTHRGVHLAFVLGLIFLVFAASKKAQESPQALSWLSPGRRAAGGLAAGPGLRGQRAVHPLCVRRPGLPRRQPLLTDVVMGSVLFLTLLEATRRSWAGPLPLIAIGFTVYALFGTYGSPACSSMPAPAGGR